MTQLAHSLQSALAHHQAGRFRAAEDIYREIVRDDPFDSDALHLLGVAAHQQGRNEEAADYITSAIALRPAVAAFHNNLGAVFHALGKSEEAVGIYREAIRLAPGDADAHFNLGNVLCALKRFEESAESFRKTAELRPAFTEAHFHLGNVCKNLGRFAEADQSYKRVLQIAPHHAKAHNNLGTVLQEQDRFEEALGCYRRALELDPHYTEAWNNTGTAFRDLENFDEAIRCYQQALKLNSRLVEAHFNLGNVYRELQRLPEAADCYLRALNLQHDHLQARVNLAVVHKDLGEPLKSALCYDYVLRDNPNCAEARFNRSLVSLQRGGFLQGWQEYEWRWKYDSVPPRFQFPQWDGSLLKDKTILIFAEQGIGDEIMFSSCLPEIIADSGKCIVECDPRLLPIFERSFPDAAFISKPADQSVPVKQILSTVDVQCPIGSLPRWTRNSLEDFPHRGSFLVANSSLSEQWKSRLSELGTGRKIGISWCGGKDADVRRKRSTILSQWSALFKVPGVHFVNLQYGDCERELREIQTQTGVTIHDWKDSDPLTDLESFAALIAELDLVISVDNSNVHLAGALGVPVLALLPFASDWRWMLNREDSPWYASVRLIRQPDPCDWNSVFDRVAGMLAEL